MLHPPFPGPMRAAGALLATALLTAAPAAAPAAGTADLRPATVAAFEAYVTATERDHAATIATSDRFLRVDRLEPARRDAALASLRAGELSIERLQTLDRGRAFGIPGGQIHHWTGTIFLPGVPLDVAAGVLQDYDRHATLYAPAVVRSRIVSRQGGAFVVDLRFYQKHVIAVTLDTRNESRFTRHDPHRVSSRIVSTRIQEVEDPGGPGEHLLVPGHDGGYLWRLNTYWRFLERDGGTYLECESISLTRRIPAGLGWLIGPFVTSIPRESLTFTLERTREAVRATAAAAR